MPIVCCGHTHHAGTWCEGDETYVNSGCWTELPGTYLTLEEGRVQLHVFEGAVAEQPLAGTEASVPLSLSYPLGDWGTLTPEPLSNPHPNASPPLNADKPLGYLPDP